MLEYVWENIISNAIKYNHSPGEIHIALEEREEFVTVTVQDTGIGSKHTNITNGLKDFIERMSSFYSD